MGVKSIKSYFAPNPREVTYWVDLSTNPYGKVIKAFNGLDWVAITGNTLDETTGAIDYNSLKNKPSINNIVLAGNTTLDTLDIQSASDMDRFAEDREVVSLIPSEYVTDSELSEITYTKQEVKDIVNDIESDVKWNEEN